MLMQTNKEVHILKHINVVAILTDGNRKVSTMLEDEICTLLWDLHAGT